MVRISDLRLFFKVLRGSNQDGRRDVCLGRPLAPRCEWWWCNAGVASCCSAVPCFALKKPSRVLCCILLTCSDRTSDRWSHPLIATTQSMGSTHRLLSWSLGAPTLRWRHSSQLLGPCRCTLHSRSAASEPWKHDWLLIELRNVKSEAGRYIRDMGRGISLWYAIWAQLDDICRYISRFLLYKSSVCTLYFTSYYFRILRFLYIITFVYVYYICILLLLLYIINIFECKANRKTHFNNYRMRNCASVIYSFMCTLRVYGFIELVIKH